MPMKKRAPERPGEKGNTKRASRQLLPARPFCSGPTRLRILRLLQRGECCVGDIVTILRVEQPSVSRHLAYLRKAGLVVVRKARQWSYHSLAPARGAFHEKLIECLGCCFDKVPELRADAPRAEKIKTSGSP